MAESRAETTTHTSSRQPALAATATAGWVIATGAACLAIQALFSRYLFWDSFFNLVAGRHIAADGIPRREVLTVEAKPEWIDQQWLAHWLYYEAWALAGYPGLALLSSVLVSTGFTLLAAMIISRGVPGQRATLWTLLALVVAFGNTVIRAQSFAFPLFVGLLWLVLAESAQPRFRWRLALPLVLLCLWANLHGTVLLGAVMLAGYAVWRAVAAALRGDTSSVLAHAGVAAAAPGAVFVNPYGFGVVEYYTSLVGNRTVGAYIVEWAPPTLRNPYSVGFFCLVVALTAVLAYALLRGYRPPAVLAAAAAGLALLAAHGVRYQVWFAIVAVALAADALAATRPVPAPLAPLALRTLAAAVAVFAVGAVVAVAVTPDERFERSVPRKALAAAAAYARTHPRTTILADENASALLWLHPATAGRVAFDTRLEQYDEEELRRWFEFLNVTGRHWLGATRGHDIVVASRADLVRGLANVRGWQPLRVDMKGAAFVRVGGAG